MNKKIGVGIITCKRPEFFKNCLDSISICDNVDTIVVVNDGEPYPKEVYNAPQLKEVIQHSTNKGVGISKNEALRYLIQDRCEHLFLVEDDMLINSPLVFQKYIHAAESSGIWHLNFGYHGPANMKDGKPAPRQIIEYEPGISLAFNPNCVGSFSYYLRGVIKTVGYMDEHYKNVWEHVDHTFRIIKQGLHSPFWWFADVADSHLLIGEQASSEVNSTIRNNLEWQQNLHEGASWFEHKHGFVPVRIPDTPPRAVLENLEKIKGMYARKVL